MKVKLIIKIIIIKVTITTTIAIIITIIKQYNCYNQNQNQLLKQLEKRY